MDSNGNVFVKTPNIDALQEWILEEKEGIKNPNPGNFIFESLMLIYYGG